MNRRDDVDRKVDWIYDDVPRARTESSTRRKPLLLYWTASWCPPCQEIRTTVLRSPRFAAEAAKWITTELSGDAAGAQTWGEKYALATYPTLLVFDHEGIEIVRLPGGLTATRFCEMLDVSGSVRRGIGSLTAAVLSGDRQFAEGEIELLAYHSWRQESRALAADDRPRLFAKLTELVAGRRDDVWARLIAQRVYEESTATQALVVDPRLCQEFLDVLGGTAGTYANLYYLNVDPRGALAYLTGRGGIDRNALAAAWILAVETSLRRESLSGTERLISHAALVTLYKFRAGNEATDVELRRRCEELVEQLDRTTLDVGERQSVMNMAGHLLRSVGLPERARQVFQHELGVSADPYYFMPYLADLARERGDLAESFSWLQQAWEDAPGAATRFALGVRYVAALISGSPEDAPRITSSATRVLEEIGDGTETFCGVFRRSRAQLAQELASWTHADRVTTLIGEARRVS